MKKAHFSPTALITCAFITFMLGFFIGRNYFSSDIEVTLIPAASLSGERNNSEYVFPASNKSDVVMVNINSATLEELMKLPGIGQVYAQRIIDYREEHGDFAIVEDLMNVNGIGGKRLESILDMITVGGTTE